jgi:23S rRNA (guanine745-N1)-methyltransferase
MVITMTNSTSTAMFACPVCWEPLHTGRSAYTCVNNHLFDVAREGYVNLLLAQHRRSKDPGYSKEMIAGRRDFFDAGHYEQLADGIADRVLAHLPERGDPVVVDAGCGEGYYLRRLRTRLQRRAEHPGFALCGLDISKHGVRVAARRDPDGAYAVASTYRVPLRADLVDVLLTHFSPVSPDDFRRVLKPGGVVLIGGPGEGHLFGLKELLYERPAQHGPVATLAAEPGFELVETTTIRYPLRLHGPGQVANLLLMTPFFWAADDATRQRIAAVEALDTEVDVVVHAYRRASGPAP